MLMRHPCFIQTRNSVLCLKIRNLLKQTKLSLIALRHICRILKIDVRNSIAFGDSENDIPMLKAAGIGIAMKNAEMDVKKASDMSTLSNNEDGIPYALRALNVI